MGLGGSGGSSMTFFAPQILCSRTISVGGMSIGQFHLFKVAAFTKCASVHR